MNTTSAGALHHTCFVVRDVEKAARALAASFGIGPWNIWTIEPPEAEVRGRKTSFSFKVALAEVGGAFYELIAPDKGESVYVDHLASNGEGFHHTCLVFATREALEERKAALLAEGREMILRGGFGEMGEFCYFEIPDLPRSCSMSCGAWFRVIFSVRRAGGRKSWPFTCWSGFPCWERRWSFVTGVTLGSIISWANWTPRPVV